MCPPSWQPDVLFFKEPEEGGSEGHFVKISLHILMLVNTGKCWLDFSLLKLLKESHKTNR